MKSIRLLVPALVALAGTPAALAQAYTADPVNPDEVRAIVSEMLNDAETRTSLLDSGGSAGHDEKGFYLADDSGKFRLQIGGMNQFRYTLNFRTPAGPNDNANALPNRGNDDFESGFQTVRVKLWFLGNVVCPEMFYRVQGAFNRADPGDFRLEDAYVGYRWECGLAIQWGQFKEPFLHEELVADSQQLAADRSLTNSVYTQDRSQGIMGTFQQESFRVSGAFTDGFRSKNSQLGTVNNGGSFGFVAGGGESDWAISSRAEFKFAGEWRQFDDFNSFPGSEFGAMLGVGGHVEQSANSIAATVNGVATSGQTTWGGYTADLSLKGDGWTFYLEGIGSHTNTPLQDLQTVSFDDYGMVAQFGMFVPGTNWEPFVRYDAVFQDPDRIATGSDTFSTVTVGTNYFFAGHAAQFTFDVQWFVDPSQGVVGANPSIGLLNNPSYSEWAVRFQFQLLF